jgi:glycosyltransferase involved in cell wall biosynthesis
MDKFISHQSQDFQMNETLVTGNYKVPGQNHEMMLPEILFITSYPPRVCGIATYSKDLVNALKKKFYSGFDIRICAIENGSENYTYPEEVDSVLNADDSFAFRDLAEKVNSNELNTLVVIQHEFGFYNKSKREFMEFLVSLNKPFVIVFHTVLPNPSEELRSYVSEIGKLSAGIIVMTYASAEILDRGYGLKSDLVKVISHGTHLLPNRGKDELKMKYGLMGRSVLSTFGLLSSGKGIETTIQAMPAILKVHPEVVFLVIGQTHPGVLAKEGENYRSSLTDLVSKLHIEANVVFLNYFMPLEELLEYLRLTDIYLFTSKDPNQAVSGTFSYAMSCGCPIISTPIPHAKELLNNGSGVVFDFGKSDQLSNAVNSLLSDEELRDTMSSNGIHRMAPTSWENSALAHVSLFERVGKDDLDISYILPPVNLSHVLELTSGRGLIQFSVLGIPDLRSGHTLDDNARALIAICEHYDQCLEPSDMVLINIYFSFIERCINQPGGMVNYIDSNGMATIQNEMENLDDSAGRAIWALGYFISKANVMPAELVDRAERYFLMLLPEVIRIRSTRAVAFAIKGLYYRSLTSSGTNLKLLVEELANRLLQMYRHESKNDWKWFEGYLTYANAVLPEAMLLAWKVTGVNSFRDVALESFNFLNDHIFSKERIRVVSNKGWHLRGNKIRTNVYGGEQPVDVAYSILALSTFYKEFRDKDYKEKMVLAFNWFLGKNHLNQTIYNPATGGCYDGLEGVYINLNQGAESTLSYLMARLEMSKWDMDYVERELGFVEMEEMNALN